MSSTINTVAVLGVSHYPQITPKISKPPFSPISSTTIIHKPSDTHSQNHRAQAT